MTLREKLESYRTLYDTDEYGHPMISQKELEALIDVALAIGDIEDVLYNQKHTAVIEAIAKLDKVLE